jgi:hypothetical protein
MEPTHNPDPQESTMIGSPNTCSRCRFFSRNACASRHCYDWRGERSQGGREPDLDDDERDDDNDETGTEDR